MIEIYGVSAGKLTSTLLFLRSEDAKALSSEGSYTLL
jgi:hypothetical protein